MLVFLQLIIIILITIYTTNYFNIHDFIKQFISQIGIEHLGRVRVSNPLMDMGIGIKNLNSMGMGMEKEIINGDENDKSKSYQNPTPCHPYSKV